MKLHLTEMQLDLYLDGGLDVQERGAVQDHLATCAGCRQRLGKMRPLFQALEELAVPLPETLVQDVMTRLEGPTTAAEREWRPSTWLAPALQGMAALALLLALMGRFSNLVPQPPRGWFSPTAARLATALQEGSAALRQMLADLSAELNTAAASVPDWLPFRLTAPQVGLFLVAAIALWLIGNRLLLTTTLNGNGIHQEV